MRRPPSPARRRLALLVVGLVSLASVAAAVNGAPRTPDEHRRAGVQTFRGVPEWLPVQSRAELADHLGAQQAPSAFPFFSHIAQYWQGYGQISQVDGGGFDAGYHLHSIGTGLLTSLEFGLKACYEATVGRLAEASANGVPTAEEQLATRVAADYARFIRSHPARDYDHLARLAELWQQTPIWGDNPLRKWERRFALSTEYGAQAAYGWLMQHVHKPPSPPPPATTALLLDRWPGSSSELPALKRLRDLNGGVLVNVPRRDAFTRYASALAGLGVQFQEVAGNQGPMLVSVLRPRDAAPVPEARMLFTQPVLTQPDIERHWLTVPVPQLANALRAWAARPELQVEHLYDF